MSEMFRTIRSLTQDPSVLEKTVKPDTARRMLRFAAPSGWVLGLFLLVVIVEHGTHAELLERSGLLRRATSASVQTLTKSSTA